MLGFSSLTRSRTYAPFSGGMSLDHGTTGEVSVQCFQMHFSGLSWWSHGWDCASAARFLIRELRSHMTCSKKKKRKEMPFSDFLISDGEWSLLPVRREVVWIPGGLLERRECSLLSLNQVPCSFLCFTLEIG